LSCIGSAHSVTITQADINNDLIITQSGGSWQLTESVTFTNQCAITVNADNVTINLQGYSIDGQNIGGCAININGNNCHIFNGAINATTNTALEIADASGINIEQITIKNSHSGIWISDSTYTTIKNITVEKVVGQAVVIDENCDESTLNQLHIYDCSDDAITIISDHVSLTGIVVYNITGDGIVLSGNNIKCFGVSSSLNTQNGFTISGQEIQLLQCAANLNTQDGILLQNSSQNISIIGGLASGNGNIGIENQGTSSNKISFFQARANKNRDFLKITSTSY
jgi:hypothetical protein